MPDGGFLVLLVAVFGASLLQAATGIGYGVVAGPILLVALNGSEAFQISTMHNLLIALLLAPFVARNRDPIALRYLLLGGLLGIPSGFLLQKAVDVAILKLASIVVVGFVTAVLISDVRRKPTRAAHPKPIGREAYAIGIAAGVMSGMLAMPGPLASTWMAVRGWRKSEIRATTLSYFVFAYGTGAALYAAFSGFSPQTLRLTALLAPAVVLGIVAGSSMSRHLSDRLFRQVLLGVLAATIASLTVSVL